MRLPLNLKNIVAIPVVHFLLHISGHIHDTGISAMDIYRRSDNQINNKFNLPCCCSWKPLPQCSCLNLYKWRGRVNMTYYHMTTIMRIVKNSRTSLLSYYVEDFTFNFYSEPLLPLKSSINQIFQLTPPILCKIAKQYPVSTHIFFMQTQKYD